MKILPFIFAAITIIMPVVSQRTGLSDKYGFRFKMLSALLYLATGILSAVCIGRITTYSLMILTALILGFAGDFFLEYKSKRFFPLGVMFFALGHIAYIFTFLYIGENKAVYYVLPLLFTATVMYLPLLFITRRLKFRKFKNLILLYSAVLVFFYACALVMGTIPIRNGNLSFGLCLIFGATLFFSSDIMIGLGKGGFERPAFLRNAVSYTYFAAQALFALSVYFQ